MRCPFCSTEETKVVDSRINQTGDTTRRRRQCAQCEGRFTTYERIEEVMPSILKKDGRLEPYSREKIMSGIRKSCQKRPISIQIMEAAVNRIERRLQSFGVKEIPSGTIGQIVMRELHSMDKVAYVRFASVYRDFQEIEQFFAELQELPVPTVPEEQIALAFPFLEDEERPSP